MLSVVRHCATLLLICVALCAVNCTELDGDDKGFIEFEDEADDFFEQSQPVKTDQANESNREKAVPVVDEDVAEIENDDDFPPIDTNPPPPVTSLDFNRLKIRFANDWMSYQIEIIILVLMFVYCINYLLGRSQNEIIVKSWLCNHRDSLEKQFALVGDSGSDDIEAETLRKEDDARFTLWCSGRVGVTKMIVDFNTIPRQELLRRLFNILSPVKDSITFKFEFDPADAAEPWALAFGQRKELLKLHKNYTDLDSVTSEKKYNLSQRLPENWAVFAEVSEPTIGLLEPGVVKVLQKYQKQIVSIHISDIFTGKVQPDMAPPSANRQHIAHFTFNLAQNAKENEEIIALCFYLFDKARRFRLSREAKLKVDKNRQSIDEAYQKASHQERQEAAQVRREERIRKYTEQILEEDDPERIRFLQKQKERHQKKPKAPKVKQIR